MADQWNYGPDTNKIVMQAVHINVGLYSASIAFE
jgi:hypothetical protein